MPDKLEIAIIGRLTRSSGDIDDIHHDVEHILNRDIDREDIVTRLEELKEQGRVYLDQPEMAFYATTPDPDT